MAHSRTVCNDFGGGRKLTSDRSGNGRPSSSSSLPASSAARAANRPPRQPKQRPKRKRIIDYPRFGKTGFRRWIPSWKLIIGSAFSLFFLLVGGFAAAVALTPIPDANSSAISEQTIVYWNDGKTELGRLGEANRINVPLDQIPVSMRNAVLAAEDREFYDHGGFDPSAIFRAMWNDINGGATQGGSTITQQYAKNAYLTQDQTIVRKVKELVLSVKLETEVSKDQILGDYLNTIYFGRGAYGVETASQAYFGKPAARMNLNESVALASILRAPSGYDPDTHRDKLQERFKYTLDGMLAQGWITQKQHDAAKLPKFVKQSARKNWLAGTNGYLLESVRREMLAKGYTEDDLNIGGFRITTTFDKNDQAAAVASVENSGVSGETGLRIGLTSIDNATGEVLAMYGGHDYLKNQLSNADQAVGLAGSTFKAFALAAAFEDGITLDSTWDGSSPRNIKGYKLQNEGNVSYGQISLQNAINQSVNTVFVDLATKIGWDKVRDAAVRAGVPDNTIGLVADPTTVLGTSSPTTLNMASAYSTFANRGERVAPTTIKEISRGGTVEYTHQVERTPEFDQDIADNVNLALQGVVKVGTGTAANALGRPAAGKTGTTDNNKSAWFVGYTPQISTAVMLVKEDKKGNAISLYGTGGGGSVHGADYPAHIWTDYMEGAMDGLEVESFEKTYGYSDYSGYNYYNNYNNNSSSKSPSSSSSPSGSSSPSSSSGSSSNPSTKPSSSSSSSAKPSGSSSAAPPKPNDKATKPAGKP